jgi:hypothetical protein
VRNKWVITFGLIACAGVIPLALIAGQVRGLPVAWRLIDCSFGIFGGILLLLCRRHIFAMEPTSQSEAAINSWCEANAPSCAATFLYTFGHLVAA